ncbi:5'-methylthioadenosine/S-adenosylhomocysteine nucleosidase [Spiroplasma chinense]|uniref:5'-methylthioadenosine/S-adenosylhomocysteine nucleosidase n=1 Tax=Spiroplasma chinense TaxID=216932 RepID=A0A5B9Y4Q7_9MOLU|nr:5'-methylthioadenosine/S-adenosylhomocysteine nucleosidase [Spiroplasma chinense]QEH62031.1 5'-methylthioadenosine/S-adenosylhomocysteine nucleosidase [Spiroplasma chinense]
MKICLLFAMTDEAQPLIDQLMPELVEELPYKIYRKGDTLIAISGVGIANSSSCFTYVETKYNCQYYINSGLVGCVSENLKSLDLVLIDKVYNSTADATGFGYDYGQVPKMPKSYSSDSTLKNDFNKTNNFKNVNIASSDVFINNLPKKLLFILPINDEIDVVDMECAGFYQAAYIFKKPIMSFKIVSDTLSEPSNETQFKTILDFASQEIAKKIISFLETKNYL